VSVAFGLRDLRRDYHRQQNPAIWPGARCLQANYPGRSAILHAHFLHTPSSVTRYAAALCRLPLDRFGARQGHLDDAGLGIAGEARFVAHAGHVHRDESRAPCETWRLRTAWSSSITVSNLDRFPPVPVGGAAAHRATTDDSVIILSSPPGREKGHRYSARCACRVCPRIFIGARSCRRAAPLAVVFAGAPTSWASPLGRLARAMTQTSCGRIPRADIFALASRVADDGDRDGLRMCSWKADPGSSLRGHGKFPQSPKLVERERFTDCWWPLSQRAHCCRPRVADHQSLKAPRTGDAGRIRVTTKFGMNMNVERLAEKIRRAGGGSGRTRETVV